MRRRMFRFLLDLITLLLILLVWYCCYQLYCVMDGYRQADSEYEKLIDAYTGTKSGTDTDRKEERSEAKTEPEPETATDAVTPPAVPEEDFLPEVDFDALLGINPDLAGWLYMDSCGISYPVVSCSDNSTYLHRTFTGSDNFAGTLFIDCSTVRKDFTDPNTIIYGHNMKNGSMFGRLKEVYESGSWKKENIFFWIVTPDVCLKYQIFTVYITDEESDTYHVFPEGEEGITEYIEQCRRKGDGRSVIPLSEQVVTLSTCHGTDSGERLVVQGILVGKENS